MTEVVDLNSKRPPVVYTVTIVHHYDDTLEFRVEDVADDERSREAVMSAFRRISGADEEIEKLQTDLRHAINCDNEYVKEIDRQNAALRAENARLREALKPFGQVFLYPDDLGFEASEDIRADVDWDEDANDMQTENVFVLRRDLRAARAAIREGGKA